jgi:ribonucleotide reductase class II
LYRLTISQVSSIALGNQIKFERLTNFVNKSASYRLRNKEAIVESVNFSHVADEVYCCTVEGSHAFALTNGVVVGQCGEIVGSDLLCNLSEIHLNQLDPLDLDQQKLAFEAGALSVAALLHHVFPDERYRISRELDPIVGVSFTGLFDFFVQAFGSDWLRWWAEGRPKKWYISVSDYKRIDQIAKLLGIDEDDALYSEENDFNEGLLYRELEQRYLQYWQKCVRAKLFEYCDKHQRKRPNRYTTCQPAGTKSLLTGASPGWHPPKAQRYIRRITFTAHDPVGLACVDYGYSIVPSQSCKDEEGKLLDDPFDPRVSEWLVEIPVEVSWANVPGADQIDISKFSAEAQFDFYMQVQKFYTTHNTSATIELREHEIETVGNLIYNAIQNDEGYISCALLARFDANETYPRLPFEPISKERYDELRQQVLNRRKSDDFQGLLEQYDKGWNKDQGVVGCDSDKCMMPETK